MIEKKIISSFLVTFFGIIFYHFGNAEVLDNCQVFDEDTAFRVYWSIDGPLMTLSLEQQRLGWVGLGFQKNDDSGMAGGDYAMGWIFHETNDLHLEDRHLPSESPSTTPIVDETQSFLEVKGKSTESSIDISWTRMLNTSDKDNLDLEMYGHSLNLLWAYGSLPDPNPLYHTARGKIQINLFGNYTCGESTCPNDCNSHGICDKESGICHCDRGWLGADCSDHDLNDLIVPKNFKVDYYATVPGARSMALSEANPKIVYVGTRNLVGSVYGVIDTKENGHGDYVIELLSGLLMPNGVAWRNGSLYVAENHQITRYDNIDETTLSGRKPSQGTVILSDIPTNNSNWHGWKYIRFGPDERLYIGTGAPCNYCLDDTTPGDPRPTDTSFPYCTISSILSDGSDWREEADGVRNTVGFDWHPITKELWFTENGRDNWGDDKPYDEVNRVPSRDMHFGFPFCYGYGHEDTGGHDPLFFNGSCNSSDIYTPATFEIGPHVAPLGMRFYPSNSMFGSDFSNSMIIALHGSWNRPPGAMIGYEVVVVRLDEEGKQVVGDQQVLIEGWLEDDLTNRWGRPVDIEVMHDGAILISDDEDGRIFRLHKIAEPNPSGGLSSGEIAGIAFGSMFGVFIIAFGIIYLWRTSNRSAYTEVID